MFAAATCSAAAPEKSVLAGTTEQGKSVRVALTGSGIQLLSFRARLRCDNGDLLIVDESGFLPTPLRRGRFDDLQVGSTDEVRFRGRVIGASVSGRLLVEDHLRVREGKRTRPLRCISDWIGFSAQS